jgi:hypothetical protein
MLKAASLPFLLRIVRTEFAFSSLGYFENAGDTATVQEFSGFFAELQDHGEEEQPEPGVEPGLAQVPCEVLTALVVVQAGDPGAASKEGQRSREVVEYLCDFEGK